MVMDRRKLEWATPRGLNGKCIGVVGIINAGLSILPTEFVQTFPGCFLAQAHRLYEAEAQDKRRHENGCMIRRRKA